MRRDQIDAIIDFPNQSHWNQFQADTHYLTHIGGHQTEVAVVFPLSGEVTAFVRGSNEIDWWGIAQEWVREIRSSRRSWAEPVIERMKELQLDRGRIGISGLSGLQSAPDVRPRRREHHRTSPAGHQRGGYPSAAPRIGIGVSPERFAEIEENFRRASHIFRGPVDHSADAPLIRSLYFDDPDGNHLEACVRRVEPLRECISHTVFETINLKKSLTFYSEALASSVPRVCGSETMLATQSGQMIGLIDVEKLSQRSKNHGRGCHMAVNVPQEDFESDGGAGPVGR